MKKLFVISLIVFWTGATALFAAGLVIYSQAHPDSSPDTSNAVTSATTEELGGDSEGQNDDNAPLDEGAYVVETRMVEKQQYMSSDLVVPHASESDCWLIIENVVYDVTPYISFHPGGKNTIIQNCGKDASQQFATKGGGGAHSATARALLEKYVVARIGDAYGTVRVAEEVRVPVQEGSETSPTDSGTRKGSFSVGDTIVTNDGVRVRQSPSVSGDLVSLINAGTKGTIVEGPRTADAYDWYKVTYTGGVTGWSVGNYLSPYSASTPVTSSLPSSATPVTPTTPTTGPRCTSWTYTSWSACGANGLQTRTVRKATPTNCTGGSPVTSQSCTYTPPTTGTTYTASQVATHNTSSNCWLIISNRVYDVTQYIPFHPGGQGAITNYCGQDATTAFATKGGSGSHSSSATAMLANYLRGDLSTVTTPTTPTVTSCTSFNYSSWGSCQSNGTQSRTVQSSSPSGCTGGSPVTSQSCTYTPPSTGATYTTSQVATHSSSSNCWLIISNRVYDVTQYIPFHPGGQTAIRNYCGQDATTAFATKGGSGSHSSSATAMLANYYVGDVSGAATTPTAATCSSFTYSSWGSCQSNGTQTRTVNTSSPSGCTGGSPVTSQSCTYTPPTTGTTYTASQVATHNSSSNCWLIISNRVYDVTQYIPFHPGGQSRITSRCGTDATTAFTTNNNGGHRHSTGANNTLAGYFVGDFTTTPTNPTTPTDPGTPACTTFTYSSWGSCQSNGTQSRTVQSSSPSGCTGGSPVTSQSCTYTPPTSGGGSTANVTVNSSRTFSPSSVTISAGGSVVFTYTNPGDEVSISFSPAGISSLKLDHERTTGTATFSTAGTWTANAKDGGSMTIVVQ